LALKSATNSFTRLNASSKPVGMVEAIVRRKFIRVNVLLVAVLVGCANMCRSNE
jgi:hypothetical protein